MASAKIFGVSIPLPETEETKCYHCNEAVGTEGIGCNGCVLMAHKKCAYLHTLAKKDIPKVNWVCDKCVCHLSVCHGEESAYKAKFEEFKKSMQASFDEFKKSMEAKLDEATALLRENIDQSVEIKSKLGKLDDVDKGVCDMTSAVEILAEAKPGGSGAGESTGPSPWVEVVKRKRKKKNILVVKSAAENQKAVDNKDAVSKALNGVQIHDVRITNEGNMVMNFEDEITRSQAVASLNTVNVVKTKEVGKRMPKIMICNVHKIESVDELINNMIDRNPYL